MAPGDLVGGARPDHDDSPPMNRSQIVSFLWDVADLIHDTFWRGHYQDVIPPLAVLRRLAIVLAPSKQRVLAKQAELKGRIENLGPQLRRTSGFAFCNTFRYDFEKPLADASPQRTKPGQRHRRVQSQHA